MGRSGQLARSLAERASKLELIALGRPELDLECPGSADAAIRQFGPHIVINAAAYTDVDGAEVEPGRAFRINAEAAGEIASAARALDIPVIHLSTDYVFDGSVTGALIEDARTAPLGVYGRSKLEGEEQVSAANPKHMILRTAWIYSHFGRNFVKSIYEAAESRGELSVVADQRGSPTSAMDLSDALIALLDRWDGQGSTYHLAGSGEASRYELACEVMAVRNRLGLHVAKVEPIESDDWPGRAKRPRISILDCSKFERDFGIRLPEWRNSVAEVVQRLAAAR
ncbi:dTDP-4-dehydrorhamnose reductase [Sphingomonas sp. G124]|uniref:dTDP-4-dehydrorhamnose reductase n=2 Tax=Sphingomonas cremea TaxID=2904799 RepID=A0A9X1TXP5_9SPHN|nr:dTDP-4-dehydrorhamnose reductase [Sphingomonas cremea]